MFWTFITFLCPKSEILWKNFEVAQSRVNRPCTQQNCAQKSCTQLGFHEQLHATARSQRSSLSSEKKTVSLSYKFWLVYLATEQTRLFSSQSKVRSLNWEGHHHFFTTQSWTQNDNLIWCVQSRVAGCAHFWIILRASDARISSKVVCIRAQPKKI